MKVALYARVSSEKQAEKDLSIPSQLKAMRKYAMERQWDVVDEFVDEAESARSANRPKFQEMIALAKEKNPSFKGILVWKLSRFARNREDSVIYKTILRKKGVQLISINEQIDDTPSGKLLEGMIEVMDEFYSINLAHDTVRGMKENAERGFFNGGIVPYGYELDSVEVNKRNKRKWKISETEALFVQKMFELCIKGYGAKEIVKELQRLGVKNRKGQPFSKAHVYYMLKNENYTGTYVWNRKSEGQVLRYSNHHPMIVSKEQFNKVAKLLAQRTPTNLHPREIGTSNLLNGLMKCGTCGSKMTVVGAKSGKFKYYACQNVIKKGNHVCRQKSVNRDKVEKLVVNIIRDKLLTDENLEGLTRLVIKELNLLTKDKRKSLPQVEKRIQDINRRIQKLYEHIESGKAELEDLIPRIRQLNDDKKALLEEHEEIEQEVGSWTEMAPISKEQIASYVLDLKETLAEGNIIEQKQFIRSFVKSILVNYPYAEIEYTVPLIQTKKREPQYKEVLSLVKNGSP